MPDYLDYTQFTITLENLGTDRLENAAVKLELTRLSFDSVVMVSCGEFDPTTLTWFLPRVLEFTPGEAPEALVVRCQVTATAAQPYYKLTATEINLGEIAAFEDIIDSSGWMTPGEVTDALEGHDHSQLVLPDGSAVALQINASGNLVAGPAWGGEINAGELIIMADPGEVWISSEADDINLDVATGQSVQFSFDTASFTSFEVQWDSIRLYPATLPSAPAAGQIAIDDDDSNKLKYFDGSDWIVPGEGGGGLWGEAFSSSGIYYDGNVGIGDFSAQTVDAPLHIDNSGSAGAMVLYANNSHIDLFESDESNKQWRLEGTGGNFAITEVGVATSVTVGAGGNVGIGASPGTTTLLVGANGSAETLMLNRTAGKAGLKAGVTGYMIIDSGGQLAALNWYVSDNVALCFGGGNVSIGTSASASTKLQVHTSTDNDGAIIGNAFIGNYSGSSDMKISNANLRTSDASMALYQDAGGSVVLNAASGETLYFRIANGTKAVLTSDGVWVFGTRGAQGSALGGEGVVEIYGTDASADEAPKLRFINSAHLYPLIEVAAHTTNNCWINFGLHYDAGGWQYSTTGDMPWQLYWNSNLLRIYTAATGTAGATVSRFEAVRFQSDGSTYGRIYLNGNGYISTVSTNNLMFQVNSATKMYMTNGGDVHVSAGDLYVDSGDIYVVAGGSVATNSIEDYSGGSITLTATSFFLNANTYLSGLLDLSGNADFNQGYLYDTHGQGGSMNYSTSQSIATGGSPKVVAMNTNQFNHWVGTNWNQTGNNRFYCYESGWVIITANITFSSNSVGRRAIYIYYDGATIIAHQLFPAGSGSDTVSVSTAYYITSGHYITLYAWQDSGSTLNIEYNAQYSPYFRVAKIG